MLNSTNERGGKHACSETGHRTKRRYVLHVLGSAGIAGFAGCLSSDDSDDDNGTDDGGGTDDAGNGGASSTDANPGTGDDRGEGDDGTAEITFQGETYTSSGLRVQCIDGGPADVSRELNATFETELQVGLSLFTAFSDEYVRISVANASASRTADDYDGEEDNEWYQADVGHDEIEFDIEGDPNHASGTVHLDPDDEQAEEANPDGVEVAFEIRCGPGDPNGVEPDEESADAADDVDDEAETDGGTVADEDEAVHPADLDIDPEDGWGRPHDGVEVPDEPGHAVLVIDGQRFELEGNCQGGEVHADDEDEERELRTEHGHFVFDSAFHAAGEGILVATVSRIVGIGRIVGTSDRARTVEEFDQFALGGEDSGAGYQFLRYADGETERVKDDGITEADEPFVRIDPSGVLTAVGELTSVESGIDPEAEDVPLGEFEFGARCPGGWDENWGES